MNQRELGRTGWRVSEVSFGAWAIGGSWGPVDDAASLGALRRAVERGVNFVDTADVYGDGRSERLIAALQRELGPSRRVLVATKAGRRLAPHVASGYTLPNLRAFAERSLANLQSEALDLLQLHCPPTEVYARAEAFDALDTLVRDGLVRFYGVSVETVDEALTAIREHPRVQTVQIVFNAFRQKPARAFLAEAASRRVGVLARVPLASGLLAGRLGNHTPFAPDDHRSFNRRGEAFDVGETFAGVDFETGLRAVDALRGVVPAGQSLAQFALAWVLAHDAVTCAIPGARAAAQVDENVSASACPRPTPAQMDAVRDVYERFIARDVEPRW